MGGFGTAGRSMVGWAMVVAGVVLVSSAVMGMDRQVVAERQVQTTFLYQVVGTVELAGGTYTFWLEDHPYWPDDPGDVEVRLVDEEVRYNGVYDYDVEVY